MPIVIKGRKVHIEGIESSCFLDDPTYGFTDRRDFKHRAGTPKNIVLHTRMGIWPQTIVDEVPNRRWDEVAAGRGSRNDRTASWHISIDADGSFVCHLDCFDIHAYHANHMSGTSVGIEMYQNTKGEVTEATLATAVRVCDALTRELGIQRQVPTEEGICKRFANNRHTMSRKSRNAYIKGGKRGTDYYGVLGHRNVTRNRGKGDPGNVIFTKLREAGYESYTVDDKDDKDVWILRQREHGLAADGVPGPNTVSALKQAGFAHGLYVTRPDD